MYEGSEFHTYIVDVNNLFSDMDKVYPGFSEAIFTSTITEDLKYLQQLLTTVEDTTAFAHWLGIVFNDCTPADDLSIILPQRMSAIYCKIMQVVTERLRGIPVYVIGYTTGNLLLASKTYLSSESLQSLLGGLV